MSNKKIWSFLLFTAAISLQAKTVDVSKDFVKKTYDATKGWWWYEEEVSDPENNKTKIIKYKVSPQEDRKIREDLKTQELLKKMLKLQVITIKKQEENNKIQKDILNKLNEAFPKYIADYGINEKTGKKCKANSSADCFVLPITPNGQRIPVLQKFLKDPSPKNSKEWLRWQAKYLNKMIDAANGLRFSYLNEGPEAYPIDTTYSLGDSVDGLRTRAQSVKNYREAQIIKSLKSKLGVLIFLGKNPYYEEVNNIYNSLYSFKDSYMKELNYAIVFPSEEALKRYKKYIKDNFSAYKSKYDFLTNIKATVRPDLYKKYKILMTPTVSVFYKLNNKEKFNQVIAVGETSADEIRHKIFSFLTYHDIIESKELAASTNWTTVNDKKVLKDIQKPNEKKLLSRMRNEDNETK